MSQAMFVQVTLRSAFFLMHIASIGLLSGISSSMCVEIPLRSAFLLTHIASIGLLTCMSSKMNNKISPSTIALSKRWAHQMSVYGVFLSLNIHVCRARKSICTLGRSSRETVAHRLVATHTLEKRYILGSAWIIPVIL
ncbi:hypothetical protein AVEN_274563-1 [Araneus ventricosus]|uniref:Uncharacterized protein n=1 Tax=Araneus ventricosus TaxID=182803 RepID=A0A4Y2V924_ARAVE|nr:hypothetical protein AVEN_274563-1 [Araneus ventricosus]